MHNAPPVISPLEFEGYKGRLVSIECNEDDNPILLISSALKNKYNIIFGANESDILAISGFSNTVHISCDSIYKIANTIKKLPNNSVDFIIINRIDLMDLSVAKRIRGSQIKAYLSMLSPRILGDTNLIVTSCSSEYTIRDITDKYISLRNFPV